MIFHEMYVAHTLKTVDLKGRIRFKSKCMATAFALSLAYLTSNPINAFTLKDTVFEKAGMEFHVDPVLLYSIALVESAIDSPKKGFIQPSPWTLRTSKPFYASSRKEAEVELDRLLRRNQSVDVGLMQINTKWHGHRVKSPMELLDPLTNARVAAQIISEQIKRHPGDAALAVGNYHSFKSDRARWYARHVLRVYTNLKTKETK